MENIIKIENQTYENILEICEQNDTNWQDDLFPPTSKSLTNDPDKWADIEWKRAHEIASLS